MFASRVTANFAIDVCAYAVASNHYHLVLYNQDQLGQLSDEEVIKRWTAIFSNNAKLVETLHLNRRSKAAQKQLQARLMKAVTPKRYQLVHEMPE